MHAATVLEMSLAFPSSLEICHWWVNSLANLLKNERPCERRWATKEWPPELSYC